MREELPAKLADRDAGLHANQPRGAVDVEHAREPAQAQHQAVGQRDVAEGVPCARHAHSPALARGPLDGPRELLDRGGRAHGGRPAALVAGPVAPFGGGLLAIARLAHLMDEPEPTPSPAVRASRARSRSSPGLRRASVVGAGSFGTALAVLLLRAGVRTVLQ